MKFIHSSDWHTGRQFHNVSLLNDQRHVLNQLVGYLRVSFGAALPAMMFFIAPRT